MILREQENLPGIIYIICLRTIILIYAASVSIRQGILENFLTDEV